MTTVCGVFCVLNSRNAASDLRGQPGVQARLRLLSAELKLTDLSLASLGRRNHSSGLVLHLNLLRLRLFRLRLGWLIVTKRCAEHGLQLSQPGSPVIILTSG